MATPLANAGTVFVERSVVAGLHCMRLAWRTNAAGVAILNLPLLFGTLSHFRSTERDGAVTYSARLLDEFGADALNALGKTLSVDTTTFQPLYALLQPDPPDYTRPLIVGSRVIFEVTDVASASGVFTLFYRPCMAFRLESRLIGV